MKAAPPFPPKPVAAHVAAAMASVQAKSPAAPRPAAAHVQAAMRSPPLQARRAPEPAPVVAAHVQRALQAGLQAKRPPASQLPAGRNAGPSPARGAEGQAPARPAHPVRPALAAPPALTSRPARPGPGILQRMSLSPEDKALEVVKVVSSSFKHGPGNLSTSSKKARKRFALANYLMGQLRERMEISTGTIRALVRAERGLGNEEVLSLGLATQLQLQKEHAKQIAELEELAKAVYFDVAAKKTRGGSCDHTSAGAFFELASQFGDSASVKLIRFKPDTSSFEPPSSEFPFHRAVLLDDSLVVDPWNPGKQIENLQTLKEKGIGIETLVEWQESSHRAFVESLRIELGKKLPGIEEDYGYYKKQEDLDQSVKAIWKVL